MVGYHLHIKSKSQTMAIGKALNEEINFSPWQRLLIVSKQSDSSISRMLGNVTC